MARRKKTLTQEDRHLWAEVAKTITPARLDLGAHETSSATSTKPKAKPRQSFDVKDFRIGEAAMDTQPGGFLSPSISDRIAAAPVRMDHGLHKKMLRGKMKPEGRIDLHGMTLAQAHPALNRFIQQAHDGGKRLVLVITGKGKDRDDPGPIPIRRGVLKHQVPNWLTTPPLGRMVLDIREAHVRHGGAGAYYVYLKRGR